MPFKDACAATATSPKQGQLPKNRFFDANHSLSGILATCVQIRAQEQGLIFRHCATHWELRPTAKAFRLVNRRGGHLTAAELPAQIAGRRNKFLLLCHSMKPFADGLHCVLYLNLKVVSLTISYVDNQVFQNFI